MKKRLDRFIDPALIGTGSLLMLSATACAGPAVKTDKHPNIVFILADDLAWSDVGYHGGADGFYETPNIDSLSLQGMRFENFYPGGANSAPSRSCLMTGMYNTRNKFYAPGALSKGQPEYMKFAVPSRMSEIGRDSFESCTDLKPSVISVAEMLKQAGYVSSRMGKWHLGPDTQGFDESTGDGYDTSDKNYYGDPYATERITTAALDFIDRNKENPFFLYVPYYDVHTPMVARPELIEKYEAKWKDWPDKSREWNPIYAAKMEQVDNSLGRIYEKLQQLGLAENTLVIFASDNGGVGFITDNYPLHGSKGNLYEGGIRTPAFAIWPGVIPEGTRTTTPVSGLDLMPTFSELSGAALPKSQAVDGTSIVPLLKGGQIKDRALIWHYPLYLTGSDGHGWASEKIFPIYGTDKMYWRGVPSSAIQKDGWKLIYFYETEQYELYHVSEDISETHELSAQYPERAEELLKCMKQMLKDADADIPTVLNPAFNPNYHGKGKHDSQKKNK